MKKALLSLFTILFIAIAHPLVAQQSNALKVLRPKNNAISLVWGQPYFFDGNALVFHPHIGYHLFHNLSWGIRYQRQLSLKSGFEVTFDAFGRWYPLTRHCDGHLNGIVVERAMVNFGGAYLHRLYQRNRISISWLVGANFRTGYEVFSSACSGGGDQLGSGIVLRDLGLTTGLQASLALPCNFQLSSQLKFTEQVYRNTQVGESFYQNYAAHGSTRHMLALNIGIGYRF